MRLGIDASNISIGGGVTHLVEMLNGAQPLAHGFDMIVVWSSKATLSQLPERSSSKKKHHENNLPLFATLPHSALVFSSFSRNEGAGENQTV